MVDRPGEAEGALLTAGDVTDHEADDQADDESGPIRRCIVSGERQSKALLIRFVVAPDGVIVPDVAERLPGRGLWVTAARSALEVAAQRGRFAKAARGAVRVPGDIVARTEQLLLARCVDLIGLARRGGRAIAGHDAVAGHLAGLAASVDEAPDGGTTDSRRSRGPKRRGVAWPVGALLEASDGAADGREKLARLAPGLRRVDSLAAHELGPPFGRPTVVHALIGAGDLADRLVRECARLAGLRRSDGV